MIETYKQVTIESAWTNGASAQAVAELHKWTLAEVEECFADLDLALEAWAEEGGLKDD